MESFDNLLSRQIVPESRRWNASTITALSLPIKSSSTQVWGTYEEAVFKHLLMNLEHLGIKRVLSFTALLVDGAVEFADGRRLAIEIKYRMNWKKACQAEWQFRNFLKRREAQEGPVVGGLVFFEEFNEDWIRKPASRTLQNGWNYWYEGHCKVQGLPLHLIRFRDGELEAFPQLATS